MSKIAVDLICLAREFLQKNTVSMYDLLQQTNYRSMAKSVTELDLYNELLKCPVLADDWLNYSEDKRCYGWYFKSIDDGKYLVGYLSEEKNRATEEQYEDKLKACAAFIKHEADMIVNA